MIDSKELLKTYLNTNISPVLIKDEIYDSISSLGVTLDSNCSLDLLNGSYNDKGEFIAPNWINELKEKKLLIIRNIDSIDVKDQLKFMEILKYHKVNEFKLDNVIIAITYGSNIINEQILSIATKV